MPKKQVTLRQLPGEKNLFPVDRNWPNPHLMFVPGGVRTLPHSAILEQISANIHRCLPGMNEHPLLHKTMAGCMFFFLKLCLHNLMILKGLKTI